MKKNLRLALQTSGFVALFALALTSGAHAADTAPAAVANESTAVATEVKTDVAPAAVATEAPAAPAPAEAAAPVATESAPMAAAVVETSASVENAAAPKTVVVENNYVPKEIDKQALFQNAPRRKHKLSEKKLAAKLKRMDAKLDRWSKNPASLNSAFEAIKDNPAAMAPKTLNEIAAINDDNARRLEMYKLIEAAGHSTNQASSVERAEFKKLMLGMAEEVKVSKSQVEELLGTMLTEKNFAYMSEADIHDVMGAMSRGDLDIKSHHSKGHHHKRSNKHKKQNEKKNNKKKAKKANANKKKVNKKANKKKANKNKNKRTAEVEADSAAIGQ